MFFLGLGLLSTKAVDKSVNKAFKMSSRAYGYWVFVKLVIF